MNFINCLDGKRVFSFKPFFLLLLVVFFLAFSARKTKAQTTLSTGDVVFTAYNCGSNGADTFAVMLLTGITSGTEIIFTDGCYTDATGYFLFPGAATSDWAFRWVSSSTMNAGDQIKFWTSTTNCSGNCGYNASTGNITWGRGLSFPSSGDQVFACQGGTIDTSSATRTYTPGTVLTGIHMNLTTATTTANWDVGATGTSASELPNSLTTYTNAIWHKYIGTGANGEVDNVRYNCAVTSGTAAAIRSATMDTANWSYLDGTTPLLALPVVRMCRWFGVVHGVMAQVQARS
ncbi:MAG: hypothetical protein F9K23_00205 [Bacteroidetes bacterium]|nr:MAG: hypothetical protein F9K23_00205 [Bacteroidota bacterium]